MNRNEIIEYHNSDTGETYRFAIEYKEPHLILHLGNAFIQYQWRNNRLEILNKAIPLNDSHLENITKKLNEAYSNEKISDCRKQLCQRPILSEDESIQYNFKYPQHFRYGEVIITNTNTKDEYKSGYTLMTFNDGDCWVRFNINGLPYDYNVDYDSSIKDEILVINFESFLNFLKLSEFHQAS